MSVKCKNCKFLGILEDEDGKEYEWCEKVLDNPDVDMERDCRHFARARNVDLVRSALIEDLAKILTEGCPDEKHRADCGKYDTCEDCFLDWLKMENGVKANVL